LAAVPSSDAGRTEIFRWLRGTPLGAGIKAESYEICEYESLIDLAREMKHTKVAQLLSQNLKEEKATLKKMEAFSEKVKPNEMMNIEQQQKASESARSFRPK
jgi:ferritin-like metal-binding protein YciE